MSKTGGRICPLPSVVLPSLLIARPVSQIGLPTDSFSGFFVPRLFNGITASLIGVLHQAVDSFHIIAFIAGEGTLAKGQNGISRTKNIRNDRCIGWVGRCGQFKERKTGDAVHQHMAFITPAERIPPLIVLVESRMDTLAFHNDKSADHSFFREASPSGCCSGQCEVQTAEKFVVEVCDSLGCEQCDIPNDFLSVDSGQPLPGWYVLQLHFTRMGPLSISFE